MDSDESMNSGSQRCFYSTKELKWTKAAELLNDFNKEVDPHTDCIRDPRGGDVIIFYSTDNLIALDFGVDKYSWSNNGNRHPFPTGENIIEKDIKVYKTFYNSKTYDEETEAKVECKGWRKRLYQLPLLFIQCFDQNKVM